MAKSFRCPNPACDHVFRDAAPAGTAAVKCPRCGKVFRLRPAPIATPLARPITPPAAGFPVIAQPVEATQPIAQNVAAVPDSTAPETASYSPRRRRWSLNWAKMLALLVFLSGVAGGLAAAWLWLPELLEEKGVPQGSIVEFPKLNCRYIKPDPPWDMEPGDAKQKLKAVLVMRRSAPDAWLALMVRDYKERTPGEQELRDEVIRRLGQYFDRETLECEHGAESPLAGQPAQQLVFRGDVNEASMSGECRVLFQQGLAYFLLSWAPVDVTGAQRRELQRMPSRFALLGDRKEWAKKAARSFQGHHEDYVLEDAESVWQEWTPAADYDPLADLAVVARERKEGQDREDSRSMVAATVVVLLLKTSGEDLSKNVQVARDYLLAQQKLIYPETTLEPVSDEETPGMETDKVGQLLPLHVQNGETRHRYVLLAVRPLAEHLLVVECECAWPRRGVWAPRFQKLLNTLKTERDGDLGGGD